MRRARGLAVGRWLALIAVVAFGGAVLAATGCGAASREYRPRTDLVVRMGVVEAAQALQQALEDVQAPLITAVRFGPDHLAFVCQPANFRDSRFSSQHQVIRTLQCRQKDMRLGFRELACIEIQQPQHLLVLRTSAGERLASIQPDSREHALRLVDLLASMRAELDDASATPFSPLVVTYIRETQQSTPNDAL
jgi:hypothetical protein